MRKIFIGALIIFFLLLFGFLTFILFNSPKDPIDTDSSNSMEGVIAQINNRQILLVRGINPEEINKMTESEIISSAESASYFSLNDEVVIEDLKIGMKVRVWYDNLDASSPAYGESNKVEILD